MIRKYHIPDLLSASRFLSAIAFFLLGAFRVAPSDWIVLLITVSLYTDAVDGPLSKRWPYPLDGKKRWWRKIKTNAEGVEYSDTKLDTPSDLFLGMALIFYIVTTIKGIGAYIMASVIPIALAGQLIISLVKRNSKSVARKLETIRLFLYLLYLAFAVLVIILAGSNHPVLWIVPQLILAFFVLFLKRGRVFFGKDYRGQNS